MQGDQRRFHRATTRAQKCAKVNELVSSLLFFLYAREFVLLRESSPERAGTRRRARAFQRRPHCNSDPAPKNSPKSADEPTVARPMCRTFNSPGTLYANASYVP